MSSMTELDHKETSSSSEANDKRSVRWLTSRSRSRDATTIRRTRFTSPSPLRTSASFRQPRTVSSEIRHDLQLHEKISVLHDAASALYNARQSRAGVGIFSEFREKLAEKERQLEMEYASKIISLTKEVMATKQDFMCRMTDYQAAQDKKEKALEILKQEHQREIAELEKRYSRNTLLDLEQKYLVEIQCLDNERKALKLEKEHLEKVFAEKLTRAQSLFENELSLAKALYKSELDTLREHESALRDELVARQEEFKDKLDDITRQFQDTKVELAKQKQEVAKLIERVNSKDDELRKMKKTEICTVGEHDKLETMKAQLDAMELKLVEQREQLARKSTSFDILQNVNRKLDAITHEQYAELKSLKNKIAFLESERHSLESQSITQAQLQDSQVHALQMLLDKISQEKDEAEDHCRALLQCNLLGSTNSSDGDGTGLYSLQIDGCAKSQQHRHHQNANYLGDIPLHSEHENTITSAQRNKSTHTNANLTISTKSAWSDLLDTTSKLQSALVIVTERIRSIKAAISEYEACEHPCDHPPHHCDSQNHCDETGEASEIQNQKESSDKLSAEEETCERQYCHAHKQWCVMKNKQHGGQGTTSKRCSHCSCRDRDAASAKHDLAVKRWHYVVEKAQKAHIRETKSVPPMPLSPCSRSTAADGSLAKSASSGKVYADEQKGLDSSQ